MKRRAALTFCLMCVASSCIGGAPPAGMSLVVGATPAAMEVGELGEASYRISIAAPPGVAGFAPSIGLVYDSRRADGRVLGPGWRLVGLSSVHRCAAVPAVHGRRGAVAFNDDDRLCLDGAPLVAGDGDGMWDAGAELHTYMERFVKVTRDDDHDWRAEYRDGAIHVYGGDGARIGEDDKVAAWLLREMRDRNGNVIRIEYIGDAGERQVSRIAYADKEIVFDYESVPAATVYLAGLETTESYRLSAIRTFADDAPARVYHLEYYADEERGDYFAPRLKRITECDGRDACLAPTQFEWSEASPVLWPTEALSASIAYRGGEHDSGYRTGDFNGDGLTDWYKMDPAGDTVYLNRDGVSYEAFAGAAGSGAKEHYRFIDFNGDGRTDVYFFRHNRYEDRLFLAAPSAGEETGEETEFGFRGIAGVASGLNYKGPSAGGSCVHIRCLRFGDFDGDGRIDVYRIRHGAPDRLYLFRDDGFERVDGVAAEPRFVGEIAADSVRSGDFNGDGRADIYYIGRGADRVFLHMGEGLFSEAEGPHTRVNPDSDEKQNEFLRLRFGDFNGDRLTDVLYTRLRAPGSVWFSRGDGTWSATTAPDFSGANPKEPLSDLISRLKIVDWNGDGRADVYRMSDAPDAVYLSDASGALHPHTGPKTSPDGDASDFGHLHFGDFNGDGVGDAYFLKAESGEAGRLILNRWSPPRLIGVRNGLDMRYAVAYRPLREVHTQFADPAYPNVRVPPSMLAAWVEESDGVGGMRRTTYSYGGGLVNLLGRGHLGFAWRRQHDEAADIIERVSFRRDFPYIGAVAGRTTYLSDDETTLAVETHEYAARELRDGRGYFVHPVSREKRTYDADGGALTGVVEEWRDWDDDGNASVAARTVTAGDEVWTRTENRDWSSRDLLRREVVASRAGHADVSYVVDMAYDDVGRVIETTLVPEGRLAVTTSYEYDARGNRTSETSRGLTAALRDGEIVWEEAVRTNRYAYAGGVFASRRTNAAGHAERLEYDARTGRATLREDADGRRAERRYDAWGRLVSAQDPAGVRTQIHRTPHMPANAPEHAVWMMSVSAAGRPGQSYLYDARGRLVQTRTVGFDGRMVVADRAYDARGMLVSETRPHYFGDEASGNDYAYDALGRVTLKETPAPDGGRVRLSIEYGADYVVETGERGDPTTVHYNAMGRPTEVRDADGGSVVRAYDAAVRLTAVTTPSGRTISTSYDRYGRIAGVDDPVSGVRRYEYDAFGRAVRAQKSDGDERRMFYDALGRMTLRTEPEGEIVRLYDTAANGVGMLARETYDGHARHYAYDAAGRLSLIADAAGDDAYRLTIQYDRYGRVAKIGRSAGFEISRNYNRHGYFKSVSGRPLVAWGLREDDARAALSVTHYRMHARLYRELAGDESGLSPDLSATLDESAAALEDAADRLVARFGEARASDGDWVLGGAYYRAAARHLARASDHFADLEPACAMRCLDALLAHRRVMVARAYLDIAKGYAPAAAWSPQLTPDDELVYWSALERDALGRVTRARTGNGVTSAYEYADETDYVTRVAHSLGDETFSDTNYRYDAAGNLIERESPGDGALATYAYDELDRLTSVEDGGGAAQVFEYDPAGRRFADGSGEAGQDGYRYDAAGRLLDGGGLSVQWRSFDKPSEVARGTDWSRFRYDARHRRVAQIKSDGERIDYFGKLYERVTRPDGGLEHRHYVHAGLDLVLLVRDVEEAGTLRRSLRYLHYDAHGSVDSVTDGVGRLVERMRYDSFGERARLGESEMPLFVRRGYTGHEHLDELGLIHMNGRLYETRSGRFLSPDPLVPSWLSTQGHDRYGYAFNNPFKFGDPSGFIFKKIFKAVKRIVRDVVRTFTQRPQLLLAAVAGYYAGVLAAKFSVESAVAGFAFSSPAMSGAYVAALNSAVTTGAIIGGVVGGAVASAVAGGDLRDVLVGGLTGGALGGLGAHYNGAWTSGRVFATGAINGVAAEINGGDFGRVALAALGGVALKYTAWTMRQRMIAQSMLNADNASGISEGFNGDGFKLGGGRYNPAGGGPSPLGGHQGGQGALFGAAYQPGSWQDRLVEAYAGPHDYLNSGYWYAADGNIRVGLSAFERGFGEVLNAANVVVATPLVAASVTPDYIYSLAEDP